MHCFRLCIITGSRCSTISRYGMGIYAHFWAIARSTGLPMILHDIPARTAEFVGSVRFSTAIWRRYDCAFARCWRRRWLHLEGLERDAGSLPGDLFELQEGAVAPHATYRSVLCRWKPACPKRVRLPSIAR